ncbi:MAG: long-chain fatty acid--CoA ligase [Nocardiaceae bacterium]|nr:long-chain fatty acid--CoA ligase [Nocardiaceae bacterium]
MTHSTFPEAFQATIKRRSDAVAIRTVGDATTLTFTQWGEQVREIAGGLAGLGVGRGDKVAIMMTNRSEFYPVDVAVQHLGAVPFSMYNTSSPEQINYCLADSGAKVAIAEAQFIPLIQQAKAGTDLEYVICIDDSLEGTIPLSGVSAFEADDFDFESTWRAVSPDDVLTLIYTSGTTGDPKGVQLTHAGEMAVVKATQALLGMSHDDRILSFLPTAHIADRWSAMYQLIVVGNQVTAVADRTQFAAALADVRPTILGAVPQVWQKLKAAIEAKLSAETGVKAQLANWAVATGRAASDARLDGKSVNPILAIQEIIADKLVLSKIRAAIGVDQVTLGLSGAAPISADVLRFFNGIGIPVSDAWGLSETSGLITMSPKGAVRPGTVGKPIDGVTLRIAEDGEVLVHGAALMKGYLNKPEQTAEAIDAEGWFHTGDIGEITSEGYLKIVDRKKEIIINAGGKNMSPANIESWVKAFSPLIGQAVAIGNDRKFNTALIVLDKDAVAAFAPSASLPLEADALSEHDAIQALVAKAIDDANAKLSRIEQIKKFRIVPEYWEPGSDVLTPTMKLRRKPIDKQYSALIESMYAESPTKTAGVAQ